MKTLYKCNYCDSTDISIEVWKNPNTGKCSEDSSYGYCHNCHDYVDYITEDYITEETPTPPKKNVVDYLDAYEDCVYLWHEGEKLEYMLRHLKQSYNLSIGVSLKIAIFACETMTSRNMVSEDRHLWG
tara:strand:+ start:78 stop:461 length:384 start_codon:yes stop_codon:yes gene_type:complete